MQLELPIRWDETDKKEEELNELLNKPINTKKHTYGRLLIDSADIGPYYDLDDHTTMINDRLGKVYCVMIPLDQLKKILTEVTGKAIMSIQVREEKIQKPNKPPTNRRSSNDEDDILKD